MGAKRAASFQGEPTSHELLREAEDVLDESARAAIVLAAAALEAGAKACIGEMLPEAAWLLRQRHTPPASQLLTTCLPELGGRAFGGVVRAPPRDPGGAPLSGVWPRRAPSCRALSTIASARTNPVLEVSAARLKVHESKSAQPRTGGLPSIPRLRRGCTRHESLLRYAALPDEVCHCISMRRTDSAHSHGYLRREPTSTARCHSHRFVSQITLATDNVFCDGSAGRAAIPRAMRARSAPSSAGARVSRVLHQGQFRRGPIASLRRCHGDSKCAVLQRRVRPIIPAPRRTRTG